MKYILVVSSLEKNNLSRDCPFGQESDDINLDLDIFLENLRNIKGFKKVTHHKFKIIIELFEESNIDALKEKMKSLFSENFCKLRFTSLTKITQ